MTTNNLTEQWKKGELLLYQPYYIKLKNGAIRTAEYRHMVYDGERCVGFGLYHDEVEEVLAPVPSYEKCKCLETGIILANSLIKNTEKENQQLKELLKECNLLLIKQQANDEVEHKESAELVLRIEEVLK